jgi:nucleotide-binding universal stress UspA family protein
MGFCARDDASVSSTNAIAFCHRGNTHRSITMEAIMSVKSFQVPILAPEGEIDDTIIAYAMDMAASRHAQLAVTIGIPKLHFSFPEGSAVSAKIIEGINVNLLAVGQETAEQMRAAAASRGLEISTEVIEASLDVLLAKMVQRSRAADIIVAKAADSERDADRRLAEDLLVGSGRPMIFVPDGWQPPKVIERALLTWDGGAKAARAAGDALPLVKDSETVEVMMVSENGKPGEDDQLFFDHIKRHVPHAVFTPVVRENGSVPEAIASHARKRQATLLVAGAYGHSRLREFVFGGVTAHLFMKPPCPLMLSY